MINRIRRMASVACLLGFGLGSPLPAQPAALKADVEITLPPVAINGRFELPPPESWRYARFDGFEVLSSAPERAVRRMLEDFQKFRQALEIVRPNPPRPTTPMTLVLCSRNREFRSFAPVERQTWDRSFSRLLRDPERAAIIMDLNVHRFGVSERGRDVERDVDHYRQLYREYARFLFTQGDSAPPPWLLEGLTQIVVDLEFRDRSINYGRLDSTRDAPVAVGGGGTIGSTPVTADTMISTMAGEISARQNRNGESAVDYAARLAAGPDLGAGGDRPFYMALREQSLLAMADLFAVRADDPRALQPLQDGLWAKQAHAFVHRCLFGAGRNLRPSFETFVRRLANEPVSEALFKECFGMSYAEMLGELEAYIRHPVHQFRHIELSKAGRLVATEVEFRDATQGEIGRIKGDALRMAGRADEALTVYRMAYARGFKDAPLLAALGTAEQASGQTKRARQFLEAVAKVGTDRPTAYVALARMRLDEALARPDETGRLSAAQVAAVLLPLLKARTLEPMLPETYTIMAETWTASAVSPVPAQVHLLGEGAMRYPTIPDLVLHTARLYLRAGDSANAVEVARMGLRFTPDPGARAQLEALLTGRPADPTQN